MQRWHLTIGLSAVALAAAAFAPRLFGAGATPPVVAEIPPAPISVAVATPAMPANSGHLVLDAGLDRSAVLAGQSNERFVVVTVSAPADIGQATHRPVDVGVVMDVSGSMTARGKIDYARRAAKYLVYQMHEGDDYSLVTFNDRARVVIPAGPVTDPEGLGMRIDRIDEGGGTNLAEGLDDGATEVGRVLREGSSGRLVLLTDGNATVGIKDPDALARIVGRLHAQGYTVSAVGLGLDYNEDLLQRLADAGGGSYNFVDDPSELQGVFRDELERSVSVVARGTDVKVDLAPGVELLDVVGWPSTKDAHGFSVDVGEVAAGQTRKIVARVRVTPQAADGAMAVASVRTTYTDVIDAAPGFATADAAAAISVDQVAVDKSIVPVRAKNAVIAWGNAYRERAVRAYADGDIAEAQQVAQTGVDYFSANATALDDEDLRVQAQSIAMDRRNMPSAAPASAEGQRMVKQAKEDVLNLER